jgi:hypothetical protein
MNVYQHVMVVMSIIVSISLTHLLSGVARLVQHPGSKSVYWVHLVWVLFVFLYLIHFWWWEIRLEKILIWTFPLYLFVVFYAFLLYLLCALLFPEDLKEYDGYKEYFYSRRKWFFGLLAVTRVTDLFDTIIKGRKYLEMLGFEYEAHLVVYIAASLIAIKTRNRHFHAAFAIVALLYEVSYILREFFTIR